MARRVFKERMDPLQELTDLQVIEIYHIDREGILQIHALIKDDIEPHTQRNHSLTSMQKLMICLRFFATGEMQLTEADLHGVSQPSVSRIISEVTTALCRPDIVRQFIKFPNLQDLRKNHQHFNGIAGFPNVVGLIDGTQIQIIAPTENEPDYVNRKSYHSINTQIVTDCDDKIIDIVAKWPGSTHDSRILRESMLSATFERRMPGGNNYLLGDSGYPCKRWLLTPFLHPQPGPQAAYNRAHKNTRSKVERAIGQLKRRWGVLHGEIRMEPAKVCRIIVSCAVLHNLCKDRNVRLPGIDIADNNNNGHGQLNNNNNNVGPQEGLRYREYIARLYF